MGSPKKSKSAHSAPLRRDALLHLAIKPPGLSLRDCPTGNTRSSAEWAEKPRTDTPAGRPCPRAGRRRGPTGSDSMADTSAGVAKDKLLRAGPSLRSCRLKSPRPRSFGGFCLQRPMIYQDEKKPDGDAGQIERRKGFLLLVRSGDLVAKIEQLPELFHRWTCSSFKL